MGEHYGRTVTGELIGPYDTAAELAAELVTPCEWFALCDHEATGTMAHPILGDVPICDRCRAKVEAL